MRITEKKLRIIQLFQPEMQDFVFSQAGSYPLDAAEIAHITGRDLRATRRTLERMVNDGLLVREKSQSYYEVSTGRTMNRPGVAYDIPESQRKGRKPKEELESKREVAREQALQKFTALMRS